MTEFKVLDGSNEQKKGGLLGILNEGADQAKNIQWKVKNVPEKKNRTLLVH